MSVVLAGEVETRRIDSRVRKRKTKGIEGRGPVTQCSRFGPSSNHCQSEVYIVRPEDFLLRGLKYTSYYFTHDFFMGQVVNEDEHTLELPKSCSTRAEISLWLGVRLASVSTIRLISKKLASNLVIAESLHYL